jgi:predicted neuraminidase
LLLVKNGPIDTRLPNRTNLTAFLSNDDGKNWGPGLLLDDRAHVSYPDGFQAPDGTIHILYDWNRHTDAEILLAQFREEELLTGSKAVLSSAKRFLVSKAFAPRMPEPLKPDPKWTAQAVADAKQDRRNVPYEGFTPNRMVCDTTLRRLPDKSWILFLLAGGDIEPSPLNYTGITRSTDEGKTWTPLAPFDVGFPREGKTIGQGPTEVHVRGGRATLFFSTHSKHWSDDWRSWYLVSDDSFKTWGKPVELPGRLKERTFIRPSLTTRDGRILLPFQHYVGPECDQGKAPLDRAFTNPRNGVLISHDGGESWTEHGDVRLTPNDRYFGWAENTLFERENGQIVMLIRADGLGGVLYQAVSNDGGRTWPGFASATDIPNPGSKATLFPLGGDAVALLHNPNPRRRAPLALWISFDGLKTWPYQRVLVEEAGPDPEDPVKNMTGSLNYPDGFVSEDGKWLHFAFDDARHRAVHFSAKLPEIL